MKLNKAQKFVKKCFKQGKSRNQVKEAIFMKLDTWNFPPEYENAIKEFDPNQKHQEPLESVFLLDRIDELYMDDVD